MKEVEFWCIEILELIRTVSLLLVSFLFIGFALIVVGFVDVFRWIVLRFIDLLVLFAAVSYHGHEAVVTLMGHVVRGFSFVSGVAYKECQQIATRRIALHCERKQAARK